MTNTLAEFGGRDEDVVRHGHDYLDRARRAIRAAGARASVLGEIEESTVGLKSDLLLGLVLGINVVAKSGVGKRDLSALVAAVHAEIDSWRLNSG